MRKPRILRHMLLLSLLCLIPSTALALPQLSISSPAADGTFSLQGKDLDGVAGIDVSVSYDSTALSNPRVVLTGLASGMMSASKPGNPIRIVGISTNSIRGSGLLATITFDRTGTAPGAITSLTGMLVNLQSQKIAMAQPLIINPSAPSASDAEQTGSQGTTSTSTETTASPPVAGATSGRIYVGGSLTMPGDAPVEQRTEPAAQPPQQEKGETQNPPSETAAPVAEPRSAEPQSAETRTAEARSAEARSAEVAAPSTAATAAQAFPPGRIQSVLERFRLSTGEKSIASLVALFNRPGGGRFSQTPAIAVADGESTVTVLISEVAGDKAPNFAFSGVKFVSLSHTEQGEWEIEVRPEKERLEAGVSLLWNGTRQDFPLIVTPRANINLGTTPEAAAAAFTTFLTQRVDLNGDGKRDYQDDYIFTANYLLMSHAEKKTAHQQSP